MNTVPAKLSTFRVERVGSRSVRVRTGYITYFTDQWHTDEIPEYTFEDVGDGYWQIWAKGTWGISRKINLCPVVNGVPGENAYGFVNHTSYNEVVWEYVITVNVETDVYRGPTTNYEFLSEQEGDSALYTYPTPTTEESWLPVGRISLIEDTMRVYKNCNTMCFLPSLKKQYFYYDL